MDETTEVSKCCSFYVIEREVFKPHTHWLLKPFQTFGEWVTEYQCLRCNKPCEVEEVCAFCLGEGEYAVDVDDGEGHTMRGVGTQKCHCRDRDRDED